jgi:hypothetical protein
LVFNQTPDERRRPLDSELLERPSRGWTQWRDGTGVRLKKPPVHKLPDGEAGIIEINEM